MNEHFLALPAAWRDAMLDAGFGMFLRCPYAKAPMSEVAVAGGVSKPPLSHYFGNKLGLYLHLWETALGEVARSTREHGVLEADDIDVDGIECDMGAIIDRWRVALSEEVAS